MGNKIFFITCLCKNCLTKWWTCRIYGTFIYLLNGWSATCHTMSHHNFLMTAALNGSQRGVFILKRWPMDGPIRVQDYPELRVRLQHFHPPFFWRRNRRLVTRCLHGRPKLRLTRNKYVKIAQAHTQLN